MPGELWVRYVVRAPQTDWAAAAAVAAATLIISLAGRGLCGCGYRTDDYFHFQWANPKLRECKYFLLGGFGFHSNVEHTHTMGHATRSGASSWAQLFANN